jgi:hypothetical protein
VNVGARHGVCRDFAVLGYCEKGLDCDKQHVRECPDFAEKGTCSTKGCKLPHVIRANRNRKVAEASIQSAPPPSGSSNQSQANGSNISVSTNVSSFEEQQQQPLTAEDARLGDEYISLTFNESESSDEDSEDEEDDNGDEDSEEGSDPNEESEHQ